MVSVRAEPHKGYARVFEGVRRPAEKCLGLVTYLHQKAPRRPFIFTLVRLAEERATVYAVKAAAIEALELSPIYSFG